MKPYCVRPARRHGARLARIEPRPLCHGKAKQFEKHTHRSAKIFVVFEPARTWHAVNVRTAIISFRTLVSAVLLALSVGAASAQSNRPAAAPAQNKNVPGAATATPGYQIQPGDVLQISVWREEDLKLEVLVRPDGGFSFPLAGDMTALGKTVEDLRKEIADRLVRYIPDLVVTVAVKEINGNKVYVIGQVNKPGVFVMNPRVDVMQALSIAGGTTPFAKLDDIFVLRRSGETNQIRLPFRFNDVVKGRGLEQNVLLLSGDVVVVP
jgi:polysaccharide export outer membrane protein